MKWNVDVFWAAVGRDTIDYLWCVESQFETHNKKWCYKKKRPNREIQINLSAYAHTHTHEKTNRQKHTIAKWWWWDEMTMMHRFFIICSLYVDFSIGRFKLKPECLYKRNDYLKYRWKKAYNAKEERKKRTELYMCLCVNVLTRTILLSCENMKKMVCKILTMKNYSSVYFKRIKKKTRDQKRQKKMTRDGDQKKNVKREPHTSSLFQRLTQLTHTQMLVLFEAAKVTTFSKWT